MTKQLKGRKALFISLCMLCCLVLLLIYFTFYQTLVASPTSLPPQIDLDYGAFPLLNFNNPMDITHAGDDRLFVAERAGIIRVFDTTNPVSATVFLDISAQVATDLEGGLLGLAFSPNYSTDGYFYVNYTTGAGLTATHVSRFTVSTLDPNVADPASELLIMAVDQPFDNHNGGDLNFGPNDGYLYIGLGDGGIEDLANHPSQDLGDLLGKMIRLDVTSGSGNAPDCDPDGNYTIPANNPFVDGVGGDCDEIWAYGLRNPWRFSFDSQTGDMFMGDVGDGTWEEINYQAASSSGGENYGWPIYEGSDCMVPASCPLVGRTDPIQQYALGGDPFHCAVIGGFVYRGTQYPNMQGYYLYNDWCSGEIWGLTPNGGGGWNNELLRSWGGGATYGTDAQGEIYIAGTWEDSPIIHIQDNSPETATLSINKSGRSTIATGQPLTYTLEVNNTSAFTATNLIITDTIPTGATYVAALDGGIFNTDTVTWQVASLAGGNTIEVRFVVTATQTIVNDRYGVRADGGIDVVGAEAVTTTVTAASLITTTHEDFVMPGTQPHTLIDPIPDGTGCDTCHTEPIYDRWRGSMMSQAGRDPLLWAALTVANVDVADVGEYCLRCHTPRGWFAGRSETSDGSGLETADINVGVTCEVCHRLVDPIPSATDDTVAIDAAIRSQLALSGTLPLTTHVGTAMMILDPEDRRRGPFVVSAPHATYQTDFLGQGNNAVTESRLCGTCHNVDNPVLSWDAGRGQYWPNETGVAAPSFAKGDLFPLERTYDEWLNSDYATGGVYAPAFAGEKADGMVASCQDCHMPRATGLAATGTGGGNPVYRDCDMTGCLPTHTLVGGNTWVPSLLQDPSWRLNAIADATELNNTITAARNMLQLSASISVTMIMSDSNKMAVVRVINETGHKLPTGYPEGRRMWLNLRAYDETDTLIYESGAYDTSTGVLTEDVDSKVYEVKQGLTAELAALVGLEAGASFHFVLNNMTVKDNRIPPRGYTVAAYDQPGMRPVGATYTDGQYWDDTTYPVPANTAYVEATLYYQTSSKEYIDFLRTNGGPDGETLGTLWDTSKSPPETVATATYDPRAEVTILADDTAVITYTVGHELYLSSQPYTGFSQVGDTSGLYNYPHATTAPTYWQVRKPSGVIVDSFALFPYNLMPGD